MLIAGRLALYMERGGRTLLAFTEDPGELRAAAEALVWALRTGRTERLSLEKSTAGPCSARRWPRRCWPRVSTRAHRAFGFRN
ncbi:hypothetical protein GS507_26185 [Rhodococcus hoagii]|nr:hypothetical protein [Prescottella equi]